MVEKFCFLRFSLKRNSLTFNKVQLVTVSYTERNYPLDLLVKNEKKYEMK